MAAKPNSSELDISRSSDQSLSNRSINRSVRVAEIEKRKKATDPLLLALNYFAEVKAGTPWIGNDDFERNLSQVETVAYSQGLSPDAISVMLEFAMSLRMGTSPCGRVLKCLIPASVVPQEAVVRAVGWLAIGKLPTGTEILFIKWVLTFFDMIDSKDQLRAIYGFIFNFVTDENLCPYICHLLYLLTSKESVRVFRVRKLLELQSKLGKLPFLLQLLSLYKIFRPDLVILSVPSRMKNGFRNYNSPWKSALITVQKKNGHQPASSVIPAYNGTDKNSSRKRKYLHLTLPAVRSAPNNGSQSETNSRKLVPLAQIQSFAQLLENMHRIELPAQMGSLLGSSLTLQYLDCVQDESALLLLNFWLGYALQEEFLFSNDGGTSQGSDVQFLRRLLSAQHFLQEGFYSSQTFLFKFLNIWDGSLLCPEILGLLSNIAVMPSSQMNSHLFEPLVRLFCTSSLFFKCGLIECLNNMLLKWLTWHSVYALEDNLDISVSGHTSINFTLSGFKDSVMELVHFVGRLATVGLQLEGGRTLLLHFILDFYETVSDMFLKYGLPLIVLPPPGVFYPALFAADAVSVDRLAYVMSRYKINLTSAKSREKVTEQPFHISRQTYRDFNQYLVFMVNCLWNSTVFQAAAGLEVSEEVLLKSGVPQCSGRFNLNCHPALLGYAVDFHLKQPAPWTWFLEYLFTQDFDGLKLFVQNNVNRQQAAHGSHHEG
ncbi:centromere protein I isoform X2 [Synchiropus splendidus]|uniref:centromere protein I isoform X2 n=1 Tax=Synchiropus splendidus TaxID=270530 RepID=UPI00237E4130|nr:centromere protein I isoform X2 [Synchiropus splendidus]